MTFYIKRNDTSPSIQETLLDGDGLPVNIAGNQGVRFLVRNSANTTVIDEPAIVVDATNGIVQYDWSATDTATAGTYAAEFEVTYNDGKVETFPNDSYTEIVITADIPAIP